MEKILVTGANGFLGVNLVRYLRDHGYPVRAMLRPTASRRGLEEIDCELFEGYIDKKNDLENALAGCGWVVHAAAVTDQWGVSEKEVEYINLRATMLLAELCLAKKVKKLVYVSTANAFAPGTLAAPGTELNGFSLFKAGSAYINTKFLAQQYLLELHASSQLPVVVVNPSFMVGPYDYKPSSGALVLHALKRNIVFYPPGGKNLVFVGDVCKGILLALEKGRTGQCYLLTGENMSYRALFTLIRKLGNKPGYGIQIPSFVLRVLGWIAPIFQRIFGSRWKLTRQVVYMARINAYYTGKKAKLEWDFATMPAQQAIEITLNWFRRNRMLPN